MMDRPRGRDRDGYHGRADNRGVSEPDRHNQEQKDRRRSGGPRRGYDVQESKHSRREERPRERDRGGDYDRGYDRSQRNNRNNTQDDYYGDSGRRSPRSRRDEGDYYGGGYRGDGRMNDRGSRHGRNNDDYYGGGDYQERHRVGDDNYEGRRSDSYGGRDDPRDYSKSDWRCAECSTWNYPDEKKCNRCGDDQPKMGDNKEKERRRSNSASSNEGSTDEFGRDRTEKKKKKVDAEWPPCFQDKSEAFVLDSRSGMFYEADSDFFYDPTSKLYYSNKKQCYFSYNTDKKRFIPVESSGADGNVAESKRAGHAPTEQDQLMLVPNGANNILASEPTKKGIAIKLTTAISKQKPEKKRKKRSDSTVEPSTSSAAKVAPKLSEPATKLQKQNAANIEKWSVRAGEDAPIAATTAMKTKIASKGKPICWVCKRKFPTMEKLQQHEEKSDLHKENLAKQQEQEKGKDVSKGNPKEDTGAYVDRAKQRRNMYGPELVLPPPVAVGMPTESASVPLVDDDQPPAGTVNVGHQMLQKLGWKSGAALGRGSDHQKQQQAALAQDWDRIENMAANNQQSSGSRRRHS